jgi:hypothetical protein
MGDLVRLRARIDKGQLKKPRKIHRGMGRLKEFYPRVAAVLDQVQ